MKAVIRGSVGNEQPRPYFGRVSVLPRQQGFAQIGAVGEFGSPGLDLRPDPLVVLLQKLHG